MWNLLSPVHRAIWKQQRLNATPDSRVVWKQQRLNATPDSCAVWKQQRLNATPDSCVVWKQQRLNATPDSCVVWKQQRLNATPDSCVVWKQQRLNATPDSRVVWSDDFENPAVWTLHKLELKKNSALLYYTLPFKSLWVDLTINLIINIQKTEILLHFKISCLYIFKCNLYLWW